MSEVPMLCAASITPCLTDDAEASTLLATIGNDAITSGTIVAEEPTDVPIMSLVNGIAATSIITKGTDLRRLTTDPKTLFRTGFGDMPSGLLTDRNTPSGNPMIYETSDAARVI